MNKVFKKVEEAFKKPPKVKIFALTPKDKQKAEIMQKLLEYHWEREWPVVKNYVESRMRVMIEKCYLIGNHRWSGYGEKGKHVCQRCGLKAGIAYNPIFNGFGTISWEIKK